MTGRELLEQLQAADPDTLDVQVFAAMDRWAFNEMGSVTINKDGVWLE